MKMRFATSALALLLGATGCAQDGDLGAEGLGTATYDLELGQGTGEAGNVVDAVIVPMLNANKLMVRPAPSAELTRRMALDLAGRMPTLDEYTMLEGKKASEVADYFMVTKKDEFVKMGQRFFSDIFLYNNSSQFSQIKHIVEFNDTAAMVWNGTMSWKAFSSYAVKSPMWLNRYPSADNRGEQAFAYFLGRDAFGFERSFGVMWNGYVMAPNGDKAQVGGQPNPRYHEYDLDPTVGCAQNACTVTILGQEGSSVDDALRIIQGSELFDEGIVQQVWKRYMGGPIAIEAPELRIKLMQFVRANDYSVPKLVREIVTSSAYAATYEVR